MIRNLITFKLLLLKKNIYNTRLVKIGKLFKRFAYIDFGIKQKKKIQNYILYCKFLSFFFWEGGGGIFHTLSREVITKIYNHFDIVV